MQHGGNLVEAERLFGIDRNQWLDLSTGISPLAYPLSPLPAGLWQRLPLENSALLSAAAGYYHCSSLLPVSGSQWAIQTLPRLRQGCRVAVAGPTYAEHAHCWQRHGHEVQAVQTVSREQLLTASKSVDVLVLANPNNPTGTLHEKDFLLALYENLREHQGWLLVDEAFMDFEDAQSLLPLVESLQAEGLLVLRSPGKIFGLAGARLGFVFAWPELLHLLSEEQGPWALPAPCLEVFRPAFLDRSWQRHTFAELESLSGRLRALLSSYGLQDSAGTTLFCYVETSLAPVIYREMAAQGVLLRLFESGSPALRIGLPGCEPDWQRLNSALASLTCLQGCVL